MYRRGRHRFRGRRTFSTAPAGSAAGLEQEAGDRSQEVDDQEREAAGRDGDAASRDIPSPDEGRARGKAARKVAPRSSHGELDLPSDRVDPVEQLERQAASRLPELIPLRYGRMLVSAFTFYRGAAGIMAQDLGQTPVSGIRVQACGDAHLSNFGGFAAPDRQLVFDINDFDETLPGPWEWDLKRLAASLEIGGRDRGFGKKERRQIVTDSVARYRKAMHRFAGMSNLDVFYARTGLPEIAERWGPEAGKKTWKKAEKNVAKARGKDRLRAFSKLTHVVDGELRIISDPPSVVPFEEITPADRLPGLDDRIRAILSNYRETLSRDRRHLLDSYRYVHAAMKVVGVGSVGTRCWIVLMIGRDTGDPLFLQVKEAQQSVLEPSQGTSEFSNHGERVVEGQRTTQSASDIFLGWVRAEGIDQVKRDYYVRQLWDWKGSARVENMDPRSMAVYGQICGSVLARAHARTGDRFAIAGYLGNSSNFDQAIARFARAYADQNERDYKAVLEAADSGRIKVAPSDR
ncbi:MAG: DUF2252 domain-containing protein [Solirubrobacterales bacterium]|nr:DUF2252 domain-containing protein [Solirubrobacterales bacterium]